MLRRALWMIFMLMLMGSALADSAYVVEAAGVARIVDASGNVLFDECPHAFKLTDTAVATGEPGAYMIMLTDSGTFSDDSYDMVACIDGMFIVSQSGRYGAMTTDGRDVVLAQWSQLTPTGTGSFLALDASPYDDQAYEIWHIDPDGATSRTGVRVDGGLRAFSEKRMVCRLTAGDYIYLDDYGEAVPIGKWQWAGDLVSGVSVVSDGEGYGVIDKDGNYVVKPEYEWMARDEKFIAGMKYDGSVDVFATDGAPSCHIDGPTEQVEWVDGMLAVRYEDCTVLYDPSGVAKYEGSPVARFGKGLNGQIIVTDGAWGELCCRVIDPDGSVATGDYAQILPLSADRYAFLKLEGTPYFSEELQADMMRWDYGSARWGVMDGEGREILPAVYTDVHASGSDRLVTVGEEEVIFTDLDGNTIAAWLLIDE